MLEDIVHERTEHMGISCLFLFVNVAPTYPGPAIWAIRMPVLTKGIVNGPSRTEETSGLRVFLAQPGFRDLSRSGMTRRQAKSVGEMIFSEISMV